VLSIRLFPLKLVETILISTNFEIDPPTRGGGLSARVFYTQKTNFCCGQKTNFSSATHTLPSITWHCTIPNVFQSQSENQWTFNSWAQVDRSGTFLFGICFRHELFVCPRISYDLMLEIRCENLCRQTGFSDSRIIILFAKSISDQKKWFVYLCAMSAKK